MKNNLIVSAITILIILSLGLFSALQIIVMNLPPSLPRLNNPLNTTSSNNTKLAILFVPVDWTHTLDEFSAAADVQAYEVINNLPLANCSDKVNIIKINESCCVGYTNDPASCDTAHLNMITDCAKATGQSYDYVIGLADKQVCGNEGGYSEGTGTIFAEGLFAIVTIHELGHEFGLNDEYIDSCRCGFGLLNANANCLDTAIGGSDPVGYTNHALGIYTTSFCAGGNRCPRTYTATCEGNLDSDGGRCIMSYANAPQPRAFCQDCTDYLNTIPKLRCTT